jgi:hypothetical protein
MSRISIFDIPLFYISKEKQQSIEDMYKKHGFTNVNHFQAVNGRNLKPVKLFMDKVISARAYNEISSKARKEWWGVSGLGAVGCALSHYSLWRLCVDKGWDFITIAEDDNSFTAPIDEAKIQKVLAASSKSVYYGIKPQDIGFGTHFYIISRDLCAVLIEYFFPIDLQVDSYAAWVSNIIKGVSIGGDNITQQKRSGPQSSIQNFCIPCVLPSSNGFYIILAAIIIVVLSGAVVSFFALS